MNKFTRTEITEYALYKHMKQSVTDFDVIFNGNNIISSIMCRYELDGQFNERVLELMPLIELSWVETEHQLQEIIDRLTDDTIESEFIEVAAVLNDQKSVYYVKKIDEV